MSGEEAEALALFVNRGGDDRYRAEMLPMGEKEIWVILTDTRTGHTLPPIVDTGEYLRSAPRRDQIPPACRDLLAAWVGAGGGGGGAGDSFGRPAERTGQGGGCGGHRA